MTTAIEITLHGSGEARWGDLSVTGRNALCALVRKIVASGVCEMLPANVTRDGTPCFVPTPLSWWAERSVSEGASHSAKFVAYQAMPEGAFA